MAKTTKPVWESKTWEELQASTTLEECCKALKQREVQRLAHKKTYLKNQLLKALGKALQDGMTKDEAIAHVKEQGYTFTA